MNRAALALAADELAAHAIAGMPWHRADAQGRAVPHLRRMLAAARTVRTARTAAAARAALVEVEAANAAMLDAMKVPVGWD